VAAGKLSQYQECEWFITGLPEHMRNKAVKVAGLLNDDGGKFDLDAVVKHIAGEQAIREKVAELGKPVDASRLIEQANVRTTLKDSEQLSAPRVRDGAIIAPAMEEARASGNDALIEQFSKLSINSTLAMEKMAAAMDRQRTGPGQQPRAGYLDPARSRYGAPLPSNLSDKSPQEQWNEYFRRTNRCNFCEEVGHIGSRCPTAERMIDEGKIYRNENGRYCPGLPEHRNPPFNIIGVQGGLLRKVQEVLMERRPENELRRGVSALQLNEYDTEEEDEAAVYGVSASQTDRPIRTRIPQKGMSGRIEKERYMPAVRGSRRGVYVNTHAEDILRREEDSQGTVQNMEGVEGSQEVRDGAPVRRTRFAVPDGPQKLERVIRGTAQNGKLASLVLRAPVGGSNDLTVEDVLAGSAETRMLIFNKKRWEAGDEGRAVLATSTRQESNSVSAVSAESLRLRPQYPLNEPSPMLDIDLAGQRIVALYDTGANVNAISQGIAELLNLKVDAIDRTRIVGYNGHESEVEGIVRNVVVGVNGQSLEGGADGAVRVCSAVYVMRSLDERYDMILGQPFRKALRSTIGYDEDDREVMCFTDPETNEGVLVRPRLSVGAGDGNVQSNLKG